PLTIDLFSCLARAALIRGRADARESPARPPNLWPGSGSGAVGLLGGDAVDAPGAGELGHLVAGDDGAGGALDQHALHRLAFDGLELEETVAARAVDLRIALLHHAHEFGRTAEQGLDGGRGDGEGRVRIAAPQGLELARDHVTYGRLLRRLRRGGARAGQHGHGDEGPDE